MMDRRKKLLNRSEEATYNILKQIEHKFQAKVLTKVRVADTLAIKNSGISDEEYSYALKAHYDFVITDSQHLPLFAVEFDGPRHRDDPSITAKDQLKNSISKHLGLPLLRVSAKDLEPKYKRFSLLSWFTEVWFAQQAFRDAQERGVGPGDEDFSYFSAYKVEEVDGEHYYISFDLASQARRYLHQAYFDGTCMDFGCMHLVTLEFNSVSARAVAVVRITPSLALISEEITCTTHWFAGVAPFYLAEDLAEIDLAQKFRAFSDGKLKASSLEAVKLQMQKFRRLARKEGLKVVEAGYVWDRNA